MSLGVPTPDPGDRMELCRKVKILPTVEGTPVRPRRNRTATSGPSPLDTSCDSVSTYLESPEKLSDTDRGAQKPRSSPEVKSETHDVPANTNKKSIKSSEVPPGLLGLNQKSPQLKAYRSKLREQLREVELNGLAESTQIIHNSDVIKNLKCRLRKYKELARQIQALQGQKLLSRDGKLFTMAKQLGLVHDDRRPKNTKAE